MDSLQLPRIPNFPQVFLFYMFPTFDRVELWFPFICHQKFCFKVSKASCHECVIFKVAGNDCLHCSSQRAVPEMVLRYVHTNFLTSSWTRSSTCNYLISTTHFLSWSKLSFLYEQRSHTNKICLCRACYAWQTNFQSDITRHWIKYRMQHRNRYKS